MKGLLSVLYQIFLFLIAVISSLVAEVLYRKYPRQVEDALSFLIRPWVFCRVIEANFKRLVSSLGLIAGLFVSRIILQIRAVLTSVESARLLGATVVILALAPGLLILLALLNTHTIPSGLPRGEIARWTYSIGEGEGEDLRARTLNLVRNGMSVYSTSVSLPSLVIFQADGSVSVNDYSARKRHYKANF